MYSEIVAWTLLKRAMERKYEHYVYLARCVVYDSCDWMVPIKVLREKSKSWKKEQ